MRVIIFVVLLLGTASAAPKTKYPFYRKDYKFINDFDAFYKLHWDTTGRSWLDAFLTCSDEGAKLFYPMDKDELVVVKELSAKVGAFNETHIFLGIHDKFNVGEYITVDGSSTPFPILSTEQKVMSNEQRQCVLLDIKTWTYSLDSCEMPEGERRPFICKKVVHVQPEPCPTVDKDYIYEEETEKCYKVNSRRKTWNEAFQICYMEGGSLLVIESEKENSKVQDLIDRYTLRRKNDRDDKKFFIGIHRMVSNGDFYTTKGLPLDIGSYQPQWKTINKDHGRSYQSKINIDELVLHPGWKIDEDDGSLYQIPMNRNEDDESVNCVVYRENYYSIESCDSKLRFICELDANNK